MKIFKKLSVGFLVAFVMLLTACSSSGGIEVSGSTSVAPLMEKLIAAYEEENDGVRINMNVDGSTTGIRAAAEGVSDIGMSSRDLEGDELSLGLTEVPIARDAIAVVVNTENKVDDLTKDQVQKIFSGQITNWKEVGGADLPIIIISREDSSGTKGAFEDIVGLLNEDKSSMVERANPVITNSNGAMIENVIQRGGAIGYVSAGSLEGINLKTLKVNGVLPTSDHIVDGKYIISRNFDIVFKDPSEEVQAFIDFILSEKGQAIVEEEGYTSVAK